MAFGFGTILNILTNSSLAAGIVNNLIRQYKAYKSTNSLGDNQKTTDDQASKIKLLESELYKANFTISSLRRSVKTLSILAVAAITFSAAAIVISIIAVSG